MDFFPWTLPFLPPHPVSPSPSILHSATAGFYLMGGGGAGEASPQKVLLKKNLQLFQIKIFLDDDFKELVKVTNVQKCDFSQS